MVLLKAPEGHSQLPGAGQSSQANLHMCQGALQRQQAWAHHAGPQLGSHHVSIRSEEDRAGAVRCRGSQLSGHSTLTWLWIMLSQVKHQDEELLSKVAYQQLIFHVLNYRT